MGLGKSEVMEALKMKEIWGHRELSEDLGLGWLLGQRSWVWLIDPWTLSLIKGLPVLLAPGLCSRYVSGMVSDIQ